MLKMKSDERAQVIRNRTHSDIRRDGDEVRLGSEVRMDNDRQT